MVIYESTNIKSKELASNAKGEKERLHMGHSEPAPTTDDCYYLVVDELQLN